MKDIIKSLIIIIIVILPLNLATAQDKLVLNHADVMEGKATPRGHAIIANGNVHFQQGTLQMFCQRVTWFKDLHETIFELNVKFLDGSKTLTADKVFYNDSTKVTRAKGNVVVIDSLQKLTADEAVYIKQDDHIIADKHVKMTDQQNEVFLTGQHAEYWRSKEFAVITGDPILTKIDSSGAEEMRVTGKQMELYQGGERAVVIDSVVITHRNGTSNCNRAEYYKSEDRLLLREEPIVWQKQDKMSGQEIEMFFADRKLRQVIIKKDALVTSPPDTTLETTEMNKLIGDQITLYLVENELNKVLVEGKATCYYHIFEKGEYKGENKIIGDKIAMYIVNREINRITIESNPEISFGTYFPPGMRTKER